MNSEQFKNDQFTEYDIACVNLVLSVIQVIIGIMTLSVLILWVVS